MNRSERKKMEKVLGISKHKKSLTRTEKFEMMRQNILHGKELQNKMKESRRVQDQKKIDESSAQHISSIATDLIINKGVPYVEAVEQAKEIYKQEVESKHIPKG
jgi:predicted S18 family serine protease